MKKAFTPRQKAVVALEALKEIKTPNQLAGEYEIHPVHVGVWKKKLTKKAHTIFSNENKKAANQQQALIDRLYRLIGQRDVEVEWLKKNCTLNHEQKAMLVDRRYSDITLSRQAELLGISRASIYYTPQERQEDKRHMDMIDAIYTDYPFYGSRRIKNEMKDRFGKLPARKHVQRLMRMMGIEAIYPKPK